MMLNGKTLALDSHNHLPSLNPETETGGSSSEIPPHAVLLVEFPNAKAAACS
jgi:hypothetical protein